MTDPRSRTHEDSRDVADALGETLRDAWREPETDADAFSDAVRRRIRRRAARDRTVGAAAIALLAVGIGVAVDRGQTDDLPVDEAVVNAPTDVSSDAPVAAPALVVDNTVATPVRSSPDHTADTVASSPAALADTPGNRTAAEVSDRTHVPALGEGARGPAHWYGPVLRPRSRVDDLPDGYRTLAALTWQRHDTRF